jgi:hypothetical protein
LFFGSRSRTRTCDMVVNSHPLYRLSYPGILVLAGYELNQAGKIPYPACRVNELFNRSRQSYLHPAMTSVTARVKVLPSVACPFRIYPPS